MPIMNNGGMDRFIGENGGTHPTMVSGNAGTGANPRNVTPPPAHTNRIVATPSQPYEPSQRPQLLPAAPARATTQPVPMNNRGRLA